MLEVLLFSDNSSKVSGTLGRIFLGYLPSSAKNVGSTEKSIFILPDGENTWPKMGRYRRLSDPFLAGSRLPTCYDAKSMLKDEILASEPYRNEKIPNNRYIFGKKTRRTLNYLWQKKPSGWKQAKLREFDPLELGKLVICGCLKKDICLNHLNPFVNRIQCLQTAIWTDARICLNLYSQSGFVFPNFLSLSMAVLQGAFH